MTKIRHWHAALVLALVAGPACAVDVRPAFKIGADLGGDTLVEIQTSGGSSDTRKITAGQGLFLGAGASILSDAKDLEGEVTLSYKFAGISAQNGDINWSVLPLDALVFYRMPNFRFGGGLTFHINPTLKGSGAASGLQANYKDAAGLVLQGDYMFGDRIKLGLRLVGIKYKADTVSPASGLAGNPTPATNPKAGSVGVVFTVSF